MVLDRSDDSTNPRARIESYVTANPGVHFTRLREDLDLATGQTQHHLRRLVGDALARDEYYGRTHYYPTDYPEWDRAALALARRETCRDILHHLLDDGPARPAETANAAGIARSTLEHHLDHLTTHDIVRKERDQRNHVTLTLVHPADTAEILDLVDPTPAERFVDRFVRLLDDAFDA